MLAIHDLNELLRAIVENALHELEADVVTLYEYKSDEDFITVPPFHAGKLEDRDALEERTSTLKGAVVYKMLARKKPFFAEDAKEDWVNAGFLTSEWNSDSSNFINREWIASSAGIPLRYDEEVVGLLFVNYRERRDFSHELETRIDAFAEQAAFAIRNTRLIQNRSLNSTEVTLWQEFGDKLRSRPPLTIQEIFGLVYEQVTNLIGAEYFYAAIYQEEEDVIQFPHVIEDGKLGGSEDYFAPRFAGRGLTEYVINTREILYLKEGLNEKLRDAAGNLYREVGPQSQSWLGIPMIAEERILGMLCIQDFEVINAFTEEHINTFKEIANQTAVIMQTLQIYTNLKVQQEEIKVVDTTTREIAVSSDRDERLSTIIKHAMKFFGAEGGKVYYKVPGLQELELIQSIGIDSSIYPLGRRLKFGEGMAGIVIESKTAKRVQNYNDFSGKLQEAAELFGAVIEVPIMLGEKAIGVLGIFDKEPKGLFSKADEALLERLANLAALVIQEWQESMLSETIPNGKQERRFPLLIFHQLKSIDEHAKQSLIVGALCGIACLGLLVAAFAASDRHIVITLIAMFIGLLSSTLAIATQLRVSDLSSS